MSREAAFIERFAEVWRAIGQPETDGRIVLVMDGSDEAECCPVTTLLGMPVYMVESLVGTCPIAIAEPPGACQSVAVIFRQEWEARGQW